MKSNTKHFAFVLSFLALPIFFSLGAAQAEASTLYLNPASGNYTVGSTFNVSVLLNTAGESINALTASLSFPPDKLQVVAPSAGSSIIGVWTVPPKFNNALGTVDLEGGIPRGTITSAGLINVITFRVRSPGTAIVSFSPNSQVFLNDGWATENLKGTSDGVYRLGLGEGGGPLVSSNTHPDQSVWYPGQSVGFRLSYATAFSYILDENPNTIPDNISEGNKIAVDFSNLSDGIHYFHVKSLEGGAWGGTSHFAVRIDHTPPAAFPIEILPSLRTTSTTPTIRFTTTDADSGIDHYELNITPASDKNPGEGGFFEVESPYQSLPLSLGAYNVIVRAYDKAYNYRESMKRFTIATPIYKVFSGEGIQIKDGVIIPWIWIILILVLLLLYHRTLYNTW